MSPKKSLKTKTKTICQIIALVIFALIIALFLSMKIWYDGHTISILLNNISLTILLDRNPQALCKDFCFICKKPLCNQQHFYVCCYNVWPITQSFQHTSTYGPCHKTWGASPKMGWQSANYKASWSHVHWLVSCEGKIIMGPLIIGLILPRAKSGESSRNQS